MLLFVKKVKEDGGFASYIIYEQGNFSKPLYILSDDETLHLINQLKNEYTKYKIKKE